MPNPAAICRVPGCEKPAVKRGLCLTDYNRSRNPTSNPLNVEARKYILPSPGGKGPVCDELTARPTLQAKKIDSAVRANAKRADIRIGAMTEFATAFKIKWIPDGTGIVFQHEEKRILMRVDEMGNLHEGDFVAKGKANDG